MAHSNLEVSFSNVSSETKLETRRMSYSHPEETSEVRSLLIRSSKPRKKLGSGRISGGDGEVEGKPEGEGSDGHWLRTHVGNDDEDGNVWPCNSNNTRGIFA